MQNGFGGDGAKKYHDLVGEFWLMRNWAGAAKVNDYTFLVLVYSLGLEAGPRSFPS